MKFLVIGGAGYIGSHFVYEAISQSHECVVYDNLSRGHRWAVPEGVPFIEDDILNGDRLSEVLQKFQPDVVLHYAALALVGESVAEPELYYRNNASGVKVLLDAIVRTGRKIPVVFSSTCAVFGTPEKLPISEDDRKAPISPYGRSKLMAEFMLEDYCKAYGLKAMALRYFNACGGHSEGKTGELHEPESHLIPNVIQALLQEKPLTVFGKDFPTDDGTCVRDYIHVTDLAVSHIKAAQYLQEANEGLFDVCHLGTGNGYSNLEVIKTTEKIIGKEAKFTFGEPRPGDPAKLFADNKKAQDILDFKPAHSSLENIITTAINWEKNKHKVIEG